MKTYLDSGTLTLVDAVNYIYPSEVETDALDPYKECSITTNVALTITFDYGLGYMDSVAQAANTNKDYRAAGVKRIKFAHAISGSVKVLSYTPLKTGN